MNNYYVLIYLTEALKAKCRGAQYEFSTSPHKNVWEAYFHQNSDRFRIVFSTHPEETALFADSYRPPKKSNTIRFFEQLTDLRVKEISLANMDRFLTIRFEDSYELLFKLFGNTPNVFLHRGGTVLDAFKSPDRFRGTSPPTPRKPSTSKRIPSAGASPKKVITSFYPTFPRHLIPGLTEYLGLESMSVDEIEQIAGTLVNEMQANPEFRILKSGEICLIPEKVYPAATMKAFDDVNDAVKFAYYKTSRERRLEKRRQSLLPKMKNIIQKYESAIKHLENADKGLDRADEYERFGHILMAHAHQKVEHTDSVELQNPYNPDETVTISVKPKLSLAENAEYYYEKAAKSRRNVEESRKRLTQTRKDLQMIQQLAHSLSELNHVYEFEDWFSENEKKLKETGILKAESSEKSRPYRVRKIDGYEVWVGRNAKSNDELTTDAHKEDVWMHARGVSGSHLVIRMNNQKEMPPKNVLLKAAAVAAWNSKARGSNLAPVIITKRKYVTKPKGAPTGTVRVMRENVEMVKPQKLPS